MESGKIIAAETSQFHEGYGEGVAHDHLSGGAAGWGEVVDAGFLGYGCIEDDGCLAGEGGLQITDHAYQGVTKVANKRQEHFDFGAISALADDHHNILWLDHAEISVYGVGGVEEYCGGACRVQRRYDLLCDDGAFSDAADHYAAFAGEHFLYRPFEGFIQ
jgi:hypothetical protein